MIHRTAIVSRADRSTFLPHANHWFTSVLFVMIGTLSISSGCQTPKGGFTGTPAIPFVSQDAARTAPSPAAETQTPTESAPTTMHLGDSPTDALPQTAALNANESRAVEQVGFVDHMRCTAGAGCRGCQACGSGDACPQPTVANVPIMLRPTIDPQEYLCNGGDLPPEARVLQDDSIGGLNAQDAIAHYTTEAGDIEVVPSNRVCVYAPRFGAVRQISGAVAGEKAIGLGRTYLPVGPTRMDVTQPSLTVADIDELAHADVARRIDAVRDRNRGVPVGMVVQPMIAVDVLEILATLDLVALNRLDESQIAVLQQGAVAAQSWMIRDAVEVMIESLQPPVLIRDAAVESFVEYDFPDAGRLQIVKVADRDHAQQGEEVTFAIHVRNVGDSAVKQVEIADSLVARLEYVEGSQNCDREAKFETKANESGSLKMKWSLAEPLEVGESAQIEFKCRVR